MKQITLLSLMLICTTVSAQQRIYPVIEKYGAVWEVPEATVTPDPSIEYKIAIDISSMNGEAGHLNFSLDRVARAINLHRSDGEPVSTDVKVIGYSGGVNIFLSNEAYNKKYGSDNPNAELINSLIENGVEIVVCGQSMRLMKVNDSDLYPGVQVATSYITALTTYQMNGFVILHF